jgi:hypothetical protein
MDELSWHMRTVRCCNILKARAYVWNGTDPDELGALILDDRLIVDETSGLQYSLFLFETMMLCCLEGVDVPQVEGNVPIYPVQPWELGPALRRTTPLNLVHAIPTRHLKILRHCETGDYLLLVPQSSR